MSNFLFFTDVHLKLSSPRRRTDDIFEAQLKKLRWIGRKAEELNSICVVCGGDLSDAWDWKISMVNRVAEIFNAYPCPVMAIIGNHDVPGRNPDLWKDTGLGLLDAMGSVRVISLQSKHNLDIGWVNSFKPVQQYCNPRASGKFALFPFHSDAKNTEELVEGKLSLDLSPIVGLKVALVHAPVGAETTPYCKGHKELFIADFDVALFGDIHDGWPIFDSLTGCRICNPGSLTRLTKKDMNRIPQIAIVYEDATIEYVEVPHTPMRECFDMSGIEAEKQELGKGFLAAIAARKVMGDIDPKDYVERIGKEAGYSQESIELLKAEL